jgi:WhiB family redox-sensing transcriptional regulator
VDDRLVQTERREFNVAWSGRQLLPDSWTVHERGATAVAEGWQWQQLARCRGLPADFFFPEDLDTRRQRREREAAAKQICAGCPVVAACREHALQAPERYGVWGALSARERFTRW